jgi:hypothetical protein
MSSNYTGDADRFLTNQERAAYNGGGIRECLAGLVWTDICPTGDACECLFIIIVSICTKQHPVIPSGPATAR